ncbi:MAG: tyrosine-type recombinase/integrase [Candidatus Brocadiia bacterium]
MAGIRKLPSGRYQGWYMATVDGQRKQVFFTGTFNRAETKRAAERKEHEAWRREHLGEPAPDAPRRELGLAEALARYLQWGRTMGGRGGRPWADGHARMQKYHLAWWRERLGLEAVGDLRGILLDVEAALCELGQDRAPATVQRYAGALHAFCSWCVKRGLLGEHPLEHLVLSSPGPQKRRRALGPDEVARLLAAADHKRVRCYEVALATGFRANELRSLRCRHLDAQGASLEHEAAWSKGRKGGRQPIAPELAVLLAQDTANLPPGGRLLYVPSHTARALDRDLQIAGIPKETGRGKADFHALRTTYATLLDAAGATAKEQQVMMRHAAPNITLDLYTKASRQRLHHLAQTVWGMITGETYADSMHAGAYTEEAEAPTGAPGGTYDGEGWWRRRESNPRPQIA